MSPTARPYARRILLLHAALLVGLIVLVGLASFEVYERTRDHLITQAAGRQELLAKQTASAIDSYYGSIAANLTFLRRSEMPTTAPVHEQPPFQTRLPSGGAPRLFLPMWNQLEGRASHLFYVNRQTLNVVAMYPESTSREEARALLRPFGEFLRGLDKPAVSAFRPTRDGGASIVASPLGDDYALCAVVPVATIEEQFFRVVNRGQSIRATLLDQTGMVMVTSDPTNPLMVPSEEAAGGSEVATPSTRPRRRMMRRLDMSQLTPGTHQFDAATPFPAPPRDRPVEARNAADAPPTLPPRLTTVEPVTLEGRTLYVVVTSPLSEVTASARTLFTRALVGAIFVILSVTAILLSTAIRLIRDRQRIETLRHEMLTRELDQARAIQLQWLPGAKSVPSCLKVAATNQTANHISGDFYDWFTLPDGRAAVSIGDVTGHGMSAAFLMATTQLLVRTTLPRTIDPGACLTEVNRLLCSQSFNGQFVTMLLLVIEPQSRTLHVATAGHMPPLVRTADGFRPLDVEPQFPLGIDRDTTYVTECSPLDERAVLALYTDGILDAASPGGDRFKSDRLMRALDARRNGADPDAVLSDLVSAVHAFRGGEPLSDDLTAVVVAVP